LWATTGQISGIPDELKGQLPGAGLLGAAGAVAGAVSGVIGGIGRALGSIFSKARDGGPREAGDPQEIKTQLGAGRVLDGGARSRMEAAFGHSFAQVRVHTDGRAAALSSSLNARAFTIGNDVAFGAGEYRPGTLIGDALLAHELAHVVQQRDATAIVPLQKGTTASNQLEDDADQSAVSAVLSLWGAAAARLSDFRKSAGPRLSSGLALQRCHVGDYKIDPGVHTPLGEGHYSDIEKARKELGGQKTEDFCAKFGMEGGTTAELKGLCCPKNVSDKDQCCEVSRIDYMSGRCCAPDETIDDRHRCVKRERPPQLRLPTGP